MDDNAPITPASPAGPPADEPGRPTIFTRPIPRTPAEIAAAEGRARRWAEENKHVIEAANAYIEKYGPFGEGWRNW